MARSWLTLLLFALAACATSPDDDAPHETLFSNGRIYLGAPDWRAVDAVLVRDGRVVAAGTLEAATRAARGAPRRVDLGGAVALPGLQDAHGHLSGYGDSLEVVDLRGATSFEDLIERVRQRAANQAPGTWVRGRGWDQNLWPDKAFPHHDALSAAVPGHPVLLVRVDGHALVANARAMELAGVAREYPAEDVVVGGRIVLDDAGRPTGVFVDNACELVERAVPEPDEATRVRRILAAQEQLLACGLTAVHDMGVSRSTAELLGRLRDDGRLKLRLVEYLSGAPDMDADDLSGFPWKPDAGDRLSVIGVKLYADGALGSRGAALLAPYSDEPAHSGLTLITPAELARCVALCAEYGLQPAVHAIGDRANREVLDAYAERIRLDAGFAALRPRVEHAQVVAPEDWRRFDELGVVASMQPTHATSDMPWAPSRLGATRVTGAYAWRELAGDPAHLAFGSDFPVERPDPLAGLYAAVTCRSKDGEPPQGYRPDQRLDVREALTAFTWGAARACRQEDRRGTLQRGYFADLTVLDLDPLQCAPDALLRAQVRMTVVNGEVVYSARP